MQKYTKKKGGRKQVPWAGWHKQAPFGAARTRMFHKCGYKCFLGKYTPGDKQHPDFPICTKNTCNINSKGLWAAYIRAKEWGKTKKSYKGKAHPRLKHKSYKRISHRAERLLKQRGFKV
tara:strand:- start:2506 stop:2862 length:357 start_codon:yes stop_codon:yes gene_type:complete